MKPILKWQYDQLIKALVLLQEHWSNQNCPCNTEGESCVRKHLLTIEAYAEETIAIETTEGLKNDLADLALEAIELRVKEERALCGFEKVVFPVELDDWARDWRKKFEGISLVCDTGITGDNPGKLDRCAAKVQGKINRGELAAGSDPWAICQTAIIKKGVIKYEGL